MNEIVISRIPVSRETTPTLCAHQTYVPRETPPPQQRQEKEFSKTITSNLTTPPCVSRETHWGVSNFVVGRTFIFGVGG